MTEFTDLAAGIAEPRLRGLLALWLAARADRAMPARADLDPLEFPVCLFGHLVLLDVVRPAVVGPPRLRYRLHGSVLADWYGRDLTGHLVRLPEDSLYPGLSRDLHAMIDNRKPNYRADPFDPRDRRSGAMARLTLPLSSDGTRVDMLIGVADRVDTD